MYSRIKVAIMGMLGKQGKQGQEQREERKGIQGEGFCGGKFGTKQGKDKGKDKGKEIGMGWGGIGGSRIGKEEAENWGRKSRCFCKQRNLIKQKQDRYLTQVAQYLQQLCLRPQKPHFLPTPTKIKIHLDLTQSLHILKKRILMQISESKGQGQGQGTDVIEAGLIREIQFLEGVIGREDGVLGMGGEGWKGREGKEGKEGCFVTRPGTAVGLLGSQSVVRFLDKNQTCTNTAENSPKSTSLANPQNPITKNRNSITNKYLRCKTTKLNQSQLKVSRNNSIQPQPSPFPHPQPSPQTQPHHNTNPFPNSPFNPHNHNHPFSNYKQSQMIPTLKSVLKKQSRSFQVSASGGVTSVKLIEKDREQDRDMDKEKEKDGRGLVRMASKQEYGENYGRSRNKTRIMFVDQQQNQGVISQIQSQILLQQKSKKTLSSSLTPSPDPTQSKKPPKHDPEHPKKIPSNPISSSHSQSKKQIQDKIRNKKSRLRKAHKKNKINIQSAILRSHKTKSIGTEKNVGIRQEEGEGQGVGGGVGMRVGVGMGVGVGNVIGEGEEVVGEIGVGVLEVGDWGGVGKDDERSQSIFEVDSNHVKPLLNKKKSDNEVNPPPISEISQNENKPIPENSEQNVREQNTYEKPNRKVHHIKRNAVIYKQGQLQQILDYYQKSLQPKPQTTQSPYTYLLNLKTSLSTHSPSPSHLSTHTSILFHQQQSLTCLHTKKFQNLRQSLQQIDSQNRSVLNLQSSCSSSKVSRIQQYQRYFSFLADQDWIRRRDFGGRGGLGILQVDLK